MFYVNVNPFQIHLFKQKSGQGLVLHRPTFFLAQFSIPHNVARFAFYSIAVTGRVQSHAAAVDETC